MKKLRVEVWSDIACPWCFVGKRRLEAALARFPQKREVEVIWRSFELDPAAPRERDASVSYTERLARKYRTTKAQAEGMIARMTTVGRPEGIDFHFERVRAGNSFDAHRVLHLGAVRGVQGAVKERLLRGYFTEGQPIGDHEALARLGAEAGMDAEEIRAALASDAYAHEVRQDEEEARALGIQGVPFFVIAGRYGISGAQPAELLLRALGRAWSELGPGEELPVAEGAVCGPQRC